ncbi:acyl-coenzyme A diphosphatase Scs3p [Monosporozyma unispora]
MGKNYKHIYKWLTLLLCPSLITLGYLLSSTKFTRYFIEVNKDSLVNTVLVKNGWFWTTLVLFWCCYRYNVHRLKSVIRRYVILTIWWFCFTQHIPLINLPPIMDLIFLWTGGECHFNIWNSMGELDNTFHDNNTRRIDKSFHILEKVLTKLSTSDKLEDEMLLQSLTCLKDGLNHSHTECNIKINNFIRDAVRQEVPLNTSVQCRQYGGYWTGGHDPSGHIFLLTLMIMLLLGELPRMINIAWSKYHYNPKGKENSAMKPSGKDTKGNEDITWSNTILKCLRLIPLITKFIFWDQAILIMIWLLIIWSWSLVVTTTSFHTIAEQLSGLFFAYVVAGIVYYNR